MSRTTQSYDGKGVAYIGLLATMAAFLPAPEIQPIAKWGAIFAVLISWFWEEPRIPVRKLRPLVNVGIALCLIPPWMLYRETGELLLLFSYVVLLIDVGAAFQRTRGEDVARFYLIGAITLVAATAFETGLIFALCALIYALALASGTVLLASGPSRAARSRRRAKASRRLVLSTAALCLGTAVAAFALAPRTGMGAFNTLGQGVRALAGFTDEVSLNDFGRIQDNPQVVMRVRFPEIPPSGLPSPMRWRGIGFDFFDGERWSERVIRRGTHNPRSGGLQLFVQDMSLFERSLRYEVRLEPTGTRYLFGLDWLTAVRLPKKGRRIWMDARINANDNVTYRLRPKPGFTYEGYSFLEDTAPKMLRATGQNYKPMIRELYLQLPDDLDPRVRELAQSLTANATNPYDAAVAVERYLRENLRYTTVLPDRPADEARLEQPLARFLFDNRAGHCEYFSSAMAIMLRTVGIPTRNVNGFLGGDFNEYGNFYSITQGDAHSWVEVYFDSGEWAPFDPTPPAESGFAGAELLAELTKYIDAARWALSDRWYSFVVTFDESNRGAVIAALLRAAPVIAPLLLLLIGLRLYVYWNSRDRKRRKRRGAQAGPSLAQTSAGRAATRRYERLLKKLARKGVVRQRGQGPETFAQQLERHHHPDATAVSEATRAYLEVRFGGAPLSPARKAALSPETEHLTAATPKLSVLLPAKNAAHTLPATLRSLAAQTLSPEQFELIAVDDGSDDNTPQLLAEASQQLPFEVRVLTGGDGLVASLNLCIDACRGHFIARMDADDECHPSRFEAQLTHLEQHPELAGVGSAAELIEIPETGAGMRRYCAWLAAQRSPEQIAESLFIESPLVHPSVMLRREALTGVGGYEDHGWPEDYDLWVRLHLAGHRMANLPQQLLRWRDSTSRLTRSDSRYAPERFFDLKCYYLPAWLGHLGIDLTTQTFRIWGAGRHGRRWGRALEAMGAQITAYIDVSPRRIASTVRSLPVQNADAPGILAKADPGGDVILVCVGTPGARALIRRALAKEAGRQELRDFVCLA